MNPTAVPLSQIQVSLRPPEMPHHGRASVQRRDPEELLPGAQGSGSKRALRRTRSGFWGLQGSSGGEQPICRRAWQGWKAETAQT